MKLRVKDIMTPSPVTVNENDTLEKVEKILKSSNYHHLPVINDMNELCGLISSTDLERSMHGNTLFVPHNKGDYNKTILRTSLVCNVMAKKVMKVSETDPVQKAHQMLKENRFRCLPVVNGDKLTGIITTQDIADHFIENYLTGKERD